MISIATRSFALADQFEDDGMIKSIDQKEAAKAREALRQIRSVQRAEIKYIAENKVPIDTQGTLVLPVVPPRQMISDYFKKKRLADDVI